MSCAAACGRHSGNGSGRLRPHSPLSSAELIWSADIQKHLPPLLKESMGPAFKKPLASAYGQNQRRQNVPIFLAGIMLAVPWSGVGEQAFYCSEKQSLHSPKPKAHKPKGAPWSSMTSHRMDINNMDRRYRPAGMYIVASCGRWASLTWQHTNRQVRLAWPTANGLIER